MEDHRRSEQREFDALFGFRFQTARNHSRNHQQGLRFIHDSGVIHLDLKPANIFVNGEGRFKIGDFGMASLWPRPSHQPSAGALTAGSFEREGDKLYLAPEVLQGQYGKAADVFRLVARFNRC